MIKKLNFIMICLILLSANIFAGTATINTGQNSDTLYYNKNANSTIQTDFKADFNALAMLYQFDIVYDTAVFKFDTSAVAPGIFLINVNNVQTDTYLFIIYDDSALGITTITGCRLIENAAYKGLVGLQILVSSIKFAFVNPSDTGKINSAPIIVTNFKFIDSNGDTVIASKETISWALFLRMLGGDINNDGTVNSSDFAFFRSVFGKSTFESAYPGADINADGVINSVDFSYFRQNFGKTENQY